MVYYIFEYRKYLLQDHSYLSLHKYILIIDSLYKGYPTGYLIVSRSHDVKLKDGSLSKGQRILIDGQQRVTALMTSILGIVGGIKLAI